MGFKWKPNYLVWTQLWALTSPPSPNWYGYNCGREHVFQVLPSKWISTQVETHSLGAGTIAGANGFSLPCEWISAQSQTHFLGRALFEMSPVNPPKSKNDLIFYIIQDKVAIWLGGQASKFLHITSGGFDSHARHFIRCVTFAFYSSFFIGALSACTLSADKSLIWESMGEYPYIIPQVKAGSQGS